MAIFSPDGTLIQKAQNQANLSFDDLANFRNQDNSINKDQVAVYDNKTDRPAEPDWERTQSKPRGTPPGHADWPLLTPVIDWTWHHLIPWEKLWGTWNGLAREKNWEVLQKLMTAFNIDSGATKVQRMKHNALEASDTAEIHLNLCWRKWNVVEGPLNTHRIPGDDPGSGFDLFTYGLNTKEAARMTTLHDLFTVMDTYVKAHETHKMQTLESRSKGKMPTPTDTGRLVNLLGAIASKYKDQEPIMFRFAMWEVVTFGTRAGPWAWGAKPTWRKAREDRTPQKLERDRAKLEAVFIP